MRSLSELADYAVFQASEYYRFSSAFGLNRIVSYGQFRIVVDNCIKPCESRVDCLFHGMFATAQSAATHCLRYDSWSPIVRNVIVRFLVNSPFACIATSIVHNRKSDSGLADPGGPGADQTTANISQLTCIQYPTV